VNARGLRQVRSELDASMPRAYAGATITAEMFNAMRAAILAVVDGLIDAAAQAVAPTPPAPTPRLPDLGPAPPRFFDPGVKPIAVGDLERARTLVASDLTGATLIKSLEDRGLLQASNPIFKSVEREWGKGLS
jgi:hypothetical protein